ncbi:hypothetical protein BG000_009978 [Podila horticola]|nr:hypothetical protein BG000_009978 [Podila horticola]
MTHPLEIPEILIRIGSFIPLWIHYQDEDGNDVVEFTPNDLIAAIKVDRIWRNTLTLLLWAVYDDDSPKQKSIPPATIEAYSHHLRYFSLIHLWSIPVLHSIHLRQLTIPAVALQSCPGLLIANPQLADLTLLYFYRLTDMVPAPDRLSQLTRLEIQQCELYGHDDPIIRFLQANSQLLSLSFTAVRLFDVPKDPGVWPLLPRLTHLTLDLELDSENNQPLLDLVRRCPRLESIAIAPYCGDEIIPTLTRNLRECCPALTSLRCVRAAEAVSAGKCMVDESTVLLLKEASSQLVQVELAVYAFEGEIPASLIQIHGRWLESVALYMYRGDEGTFRGAGMVLSACPNLASFAMCFDDPPEEYRVSGAMFLDPWECPRLEWIKLDRCVSEWVDDDQGEDKGFALDDKLSEQGWVLKRAPKENGMRIFVDRVRHFKDRVLERVVGLARMRDISIENYDYVRRARN